MGLKDKARTVVMKLIRHTIENVDSKVDITKLRQEYQKNKLRLFAINVTDLNYSAVIDTTGGHLELLGEGDVQDYSDIDEINLVVNLTSPVLFDIVENKIDPLRAYLLGRITVLKSDPNTFAADLKIVNKVFYKMYDVLHN